MKAIGILIRRALWVGMVVLVILGAFLVLASFSAYVYRQLRGPALDAIGSIANSVSKQVVDFATTNPTTNPTVNLVTTNPATTSTVNLPTSSAVSQEVASTAIYSEVWLMLGRVSKDRAMTDLHQLSGDVPICTNDGCYTITNRQTGSKGLHWAKDYIYQELVKLGYSTKLQDWSSSGYTDQNIIARKPGTSSPNEEIYFVAHMDGVKNAGEGLFPAADDNASGVVDLLEMARVLSSYSFDRTIVLLFTTGEEQGTLGVESFISQLSQEELNSIKYVVDVDMEGYDANNDGIMELWYGGHSPSFALAQIMDETIKAYQLKLTPRFIIGCG